MGHGIEENDRMMYNGQNGLPWHGIGTRVEGLATAAQCIEAANLGWTVEKRKLYVDGPGPDEVTQVPGRFATVRADTNAVLGVVGGDYTVVQNSEAFGFFDAVAEKGVAMFETAGSLLSGKRVWIMAKVPGMIRVLGDDVAEKFLLLAKGHDGGMEIQVGFTAVRVVCMNTLTMAVGDAVRGGQVRDGFMTIRHTASAQQRLIEVGCLIKACSEHYEAAAVKLQAFAKTPMPDKDAELFFRRVYNREVAEADKRLFKEWRGLKVLQDLRESGRGQDLPGVRGTLWAAYNAVTEHEDHARKLHEGTDRLNRTWFGAGARTKLEAFALAGQYVEKGSDLFKEP